MLGSQAWSWFGNKPFPSPGADNLQVALDPPSTWNGPDLSAKTFAYIIYFAVNTLYWLHPKLDFAKVREPSGGATVAVKCRHFTPFPSFLSQSLLSLTKLTMTTVGILVASTSAPQSHASMLLAVQCLVNAAFDVAAERPRQTPRAPHRPSTAPPSASAAAADVATTGPSQAMAAGEFGDAVTRRDGMKACEGLCSALADQDQVSHTTVQLAVQTLMPLCFVFLLYVVS